MDDKDDKRSIAVKQHCVVMEKITQTNTEWVSVDLSTEQTTNYCERWKCYRIFILNKTKRLKMTVEYVKMIEKVKPTCLDRETAIWGQSTVGKCKFFSCRRRAYETYSNRYGTVDQWHNWQKIGLAACNYSKLSGMWQEFVNWQTENLHGQLIVTWYFVLSKF